MPVTFKPAPHGANSVQRLQETTAFNLLRSSCHSQWDKCDEVLQSFLGSGQNAQGKALLPASGGLVTTVTDAYRNHQALVLRPDDVWLSILVQFNFYVNAHAEELRGKFVSHEGKQELVVGTVGNRYSVDFGRLAAQMTSEMHKYIVDPAVREWILPNFSTTTDNDTVVAAVVMMATLKAYFSYTFELTCGIPQVTLEGNKADWEEVLRRASKLKEYGQEPEAWYALLEPVLTRFVRAFDAPDAADNLEFWQKVAHFQGGGSGPTWLSGWITAFCAFSPKGQWLGLPLGEKATSLGSMQDIEREVQQNPFGKPKTALTLDNAFYHVVDTKDIPNGWADVDVIVHDNGVQFNSTMVAGLVATRVSDSEDMQLSSTGKSDVISPVPGWWIFTKRKGESREQEEIRELLERMRSQN